MGKRVRIWVDDERPAPDGYRRARSVNEAVEQTSELIIRRSANGQRTKNCPLTADG